MTIYSFWNDINIIEIRKGIYCTAQDNQFKYWQEYFDACYTRSQTFPLILMGKLSVILCSVTLCNFLFETQLSYKLRSPCTYYSDAYLVTITKYWYCVKKYIPSCSSRSVEDISDFLYNHHKQECAGLQYFIVCIWLDESAMYGYEHF
jgi:hypothetical protein